MLRVVLSPRNIRSTHLQFERVYYLLTGNDKGIIVNIGRLLSERGHIKKNFAC